MDERDSDRTVARIFYEVGVLKNDLVPILLSTLGTNSKGDRIALACGMFYSFFSPYDHDLFFFKIFSRINGSNDLANRCSRRIKGC